jgi:hypothetical protein
MDAPQFDRLTQLVGRSLSRRRLGAVLSALGLGAGVGMASAEAKHKHKHKKKNHKKATCTRKLKDKCLRRERECEKGECVLCTARNAQCRAGIIRICGDPEDFCVCSALAGGGFACAEQRPEECPAGSECIGNLDCAAGEVCVDISGDDCCGGESFGICRKRCSEKSPGL